MTADPDHEGVVPARIPVDIERADHILGPLTARQTAVCAVTALVLYAGYHTTSALITPLAYLALVAPVAGTVLALVLGRREGITMDRFAVAALTFWRSSKRLVHAPEGMPPLPEVLNRQLAAAAGPKPVAARLPCAGISQAGVLDLRGDGRAAVAWCSTVNFDLRSGTEQQQVTAGFARWLNSLTGPVQILLRTHRTDLAPMAHELHDQAGALPHPALESAARSYADYLTQLATQRELLARQILLIAREPVNQPRHNPAAAAAEGRATQRIHEAVRALTTAQITTTPLDAAAVEQALAAAFNPDTPASPQEGALT